jgi:stress-induced morphogen
MLASLTGLGLSAAAGLNAYIPLLLVGLLARFTGVVELPEPYRWIQSGWALGVVAALLLAEVVLDKVPVVDHLNDVVQTLVRPMVGGVIFAATVAAGQADASTWMQQHQWVAVLLGVVVAGAVHALKATARPLVNVSTVGVGTPVVSAAEDAASLSLSLVAVFLPVLVLVALALLIWAGVAVRRAAARRGGRGRRPPPPDGPPPAWSGRWTRSS